MLDELNLKLIQALQRNGRQNYTELAKMLAVSEGTIRRRVRNLQKRGFMKIVAILDPHKIGYGFISIMGIQVRMADLRKVGETLAQKPNVYYVAFVTGHYDLVVMIMSHTPQELSDFIQKYISSIPSITRTETFVNLEIIKSPWTEPGILFNPLVD